MSFEFNPRNLQFTFQSEMAQKRQKLLIHISVVLSLTIGTCAFTKNWRLKVVMLCLVEVLCSSLLRVNRLSVLSMSNRKRAKHKRTESIVHTKPITSSAEIIS